MKRYVLVVSMVLMCASAGVQAYGDDDETSVADPVTFNVAVLKPVDDHLKRSAIKAFLNRGWDIQKADATSVTAIIKNNTVATIGFDEQMNVKVSHIKGGNPGRIRSWLENLKKDMLVELTYCGQL